MKVFFMFEGMKREEICHKGVVFRKLTRIVEYDMIDEKSAMLCPVIEKKRN